MAENKNTENIEQNLDEELAGKDEAQRAEEESETKDSEKTGKASRKEKLAHKELEEKQKQIDELKAKLKEDDDKYMRLFAEYDNFRKRAQKEKDSMYTEGICDGVEKLLAVLDNLERAAAVDPESTDAKSVIDGVVKTLDQAKEVFKSLGVEEIPASGEKFNPELHNAVMHEDNPELDENVVSDVFMKGYRRGDKIIRHSVVKVVN